MPKMTKQERMNVLIDEHKREIGAALKEWNRLYDIAYTNFHKKSKELYEEFKE